MPTALNAALGALSPARSGSGSALITAMRQVGGTIGVAVLGTVLATVYRSHLHLSGLPAAAATAIKESVAGGVATAQAAGSAPLLGQRPARVRPRPGRDALGVQRDRDRLGAAGARVPSRPDARPPAERPLTSVARTSVRGQPSTAMTRSPSNAQAATSALDKSRMTT